MNQLTDITTELAFILLHCLLFLLNFKIMKKKLLHPAVLFSLLWFCILFFHFIFRLTILDELFPISVSTYLIFFIGALAFSFGSYLQTVIKEKNALLPPPQRIASSRKNLISLNLRYILVGLVVIGLPFFILAAYRVFLASNYDNFLIGLRLELSYGQEEMGPVKYLFSFSLVVYALSLYSLLKEKTPVNKILFIISLIAVIIYTVFSTGRTVFLIILLLYLGMNCFYNKNFSKKKLLSVIVAFIVIFVSFGVIYGKGGNTENSVNENVKPAVQGTAIYMVGGLNALEWELNHQYRINYNGNNSLSFFIKLGRQFNLLSDTKVNELFTPFVLVPYPTNVYTFYSPYIKDFGKIYAWSIIALLGFFQTYLYYKALEKKNIRFSLWYSFLLFPLLMSFFADQYFSLISYWIQFAVCIEGILFFNNFFTSKK